MNDVAQVNQVMDSTISLYKETSSDDSVVKVLSSPSIKQAIMTMARSPLLEKVGNENQRYAEAVTRITLGLSIGLMPMQAIQQIANVKGRYTIWGDAALALVRKSGQCIFIKHDYHGEGDDLTCTVTTQRKGEPYEISDSFSIGQAKKAGIHRNTWLQYPERMLLNRARSYLLRNVYGDILMGMFTTEELQDIPQNDERQVDAVFQENIEQKQDEKDEIVSSTSKDDMDDLALGIIEKMQREEDPKIRKIIFDSGDGDNLSGRDIAMACSTELQHEMADLLGDKPEGDNQDD